MTAIGPAFGNVFDRTIARPGHGDAVFGRDVLSALVATLAESAARPRSDWAWGPGVLGCSMWMDDPALIEVLGRMANVCIVITKQPARTYEKPGFARVKGLASRTGLVQSAYPELEAMAPADDGGKPIMVGPFTQLPEPDIGAVRELGFRRAGDRLVPLVHAKMLLLGQMGWTDEHPSGDVVESLHFVPERLWIGSANFTESSRQSLEMGLWTTDAELLEAAREWLLGLVAMSEPLQSVSDGPDPELLPVAFDDTAMLEQSREMEPDYYDE